MLGTFHFVIGWIMYITARLGTKHSTTKDVPPICEHGDFMPLLT